MNDLPRKGSGIIGSGGKLRNATADIISSGSVLLHPAYTSSTSRALSMG